MKSNENYHSIDMNDEYERRYKQSARRKKLKNGLIILASLVAIGSLAIWGAWHLASMALVY